MRHQRSYTPADDVTVSDRAILTLLLDDDSQRPWAVAELARELGDPEETHDALARLHGAGLIHRLEGFVFATRPAVRGWRYEQ